MYCKMPFDIFFSFPFFLVFNLVLETKAAQHKNFSHKAQHFYIKKPNNCHTKEDLEDKCLYLKSLDRWKLSKISQEARIRKELRHVEVFHVVLMYCM